MRVERKNRRGSPVQFLAVLLFSAGGFLLATQEFRLTTRFYDALYLATTIETGKSVSAAAVEATSRRFLDAGGDGECRADIVKSGMTLLLTNLDLQNPVRDYDAWAKAAGSAQTYLEHALGCLPTDGNIWLRLAMVKRASGEQAEEMASLMAHSQRLAPAEKPIVAGRFQLWNRLTSQTLEKATDTLRSDIAVYDLYYWGKPVDAMRNPGEALKTSEAFTKNRQQK